MAVARGAGDAAGLPDPPPYLPTAPASPAGRGVSPTRATGAGPRPYFKNPS
jgi:hypothetical protein